MDFLKTSQEGIDLIKFFEGFRAERYRDSGGIDTIGYGHAIRPGEKMSQISTIEAEKILRDDVGIAERYIQKKLGYINNQNEFDALVSFIFNIGQGNFENSSVHRYLKLKEPAMAMQWWAKWIRDSRSNIMPGLVSRREKEIRLFNQKGQYLTESKLKELFPTSKMVAA